MMEMMGDWEVYVPSHIAADITGRTQYERIHMSAVGGGRWEVCFSDCASMGFKKKLTLTHTQAGSENAEEFSLVLYDEILCVEITINTVPGNGLETTLSASASQRGSRIVVDRGASKGECHFHKDVIREIYAARWYLVDGAKNSSTNPHD